jgi:2-polyprenyl-3-methyl-5-hydroxy-6-metoxy-1,4-benzoquinol methylase
MSNNGYFRTTDPTVSRVGGMDLLPSWWSRPYEYAWAVQFAKPGQVVMDAGCGWSGRPFKEELADAGCDVYAIDADPRVLELPAHEGVRLIVRTFLEPMDDLPQFDVIFCLSVLEDLTADLPEVLKKFASKLKDDGEIVVTFDTPYNKEKPTPTYPGLNLTDFCNALEFARLMIVGTVDTSTDALVHHAEWNLAVTHWVLRKA